MCLFFFLGKYSELLARFGLFDGSFNETPECRDAGNKDDADDDQREIVLNKRNASEEITRQHKQTDPGDAADDVEKSKLGEVHMAHAGDKGSKRTQKRHEACDDDGKRAVFFEETIL